MRALLDHWLAAGRRQELQTYLIVDASWQEDLARQVRSLPNGWDALLGSAGDQKESAHRRAPLIVDLGKRPEIIPIWLGETAENRLGIVVFSRLDLPEIRKRLKRFTSVSTPERDGVSYLRFFDGRTLYCFLVSGFAEQWQDFFKDIAMILSTSDLSADWTAYRLRNGGLEIGIANNGASDIVWHQCQNDEPGDPHYRAAFPFRRFTEHQYQKILACSRRSFHVEIAQFLLRAFPDEPAALDTAELMSMVERCHSRVDQLGHESHQLGNRRRYCRSRAHSADFFR